MRIPFWRTRKKTAAVALDPVLAAEQWRRVVEWGDAEQELEPSAAGDDHAGEAAEGEQRASSSDL